MIAAITPNPFLPRRSSRSTADMISADTVAAKMTPAQIEEAQRLAREWLAAHP
jgi:hypothetical protein